MKKIIIFVSLVLVVFSCSIGQDGVENPSLPVKTAAENGEILSYNILSVNENADLQLLENAGLIPLEQLEIGDSSFIKVGVTESALEDWIDQLPGVENHSDEITYHCFTTPTDPFYGSYQYSSQVTGLNPVWDNYQGTGITVAVVDSGVNNLHEDFGGVSAFVAGYDTISEAALPTDSNSDDNGHGSHVAGIIGARHNAAGIAGAAPGVSIMPVKVMDETGSGGSFDIAQGITWAVDNGADVINLSLGGVGLSYVTNKAVNYALTNGVVVVVASGNDSHQLINYPAALHGVITVASTNGRSEISDFSTGASYISVAAPGENIFSLSHESNDGYLMMSGTSMATPFVSAIAALLLEKYPAATPAQIKEMLETTASDIGDSGFDNWAGHGLIQPATAIDAALPDLTSASLSISASNTEESIPELLVYIRDSSGVIVTAAVTDETGNITVPGLTPGDYTVESVYFGETIESATVTLANGSTEPVALTFTQDLLTFNTGPSSSQTNGVDCMILIIEDNGVDNLYASAAMDDTASSHYPSITFPVTAGIDYYVAFTFSDSSIDDFGYLSLQYTLGSSLDFSGDDNSNRVSLRETPAEAESNGAIVPDTSYYTCAWEDNYDFYLLYLDFNL